MVLANWLSDLTCRYRSLGTEVEWDNLQEKGKGWKKNGARNRRTSRESLKAEYFPESTGESFIGNSKEFII